MDKNDFSVIAWQKTDLDKKESLYQHWSNGLKMVIIKNGVRMELDEEEIELLAKQLPMTIGGRY